MNYAFVEIYVSFLAAGITPQTSLDFIESPELGKRRIDTAFRNSDDGDQERARESPQSTIFKQAKSNFEKLDQQTANQVHAKRYGFLRCDFMEA